MNGAGQDSTGKEVVGGGVKGGRLLEEGEKKGKGRRMNRVGRVRSTVGGDWVRGRQ